MLNFSVAIFLSLCSLTLILSHPGHQEASSKYTGKKVLLISFDGFRHDYIQKAKEKGFNVSAFEWIASHGTSAKKLKPVFPSLTFPNHVSLATGVFPEKHGVVDNIFYDVKSKKIFSTYDPSQQLQSYWYQNNQSEPIWITNEKAGRESAVFLWPGSTITYGDNSATYNFGMFSRTPSLIYQFEWVLRRLKLPKVSLGLAYYYEPDEAGHKYGPDSEEILKRIAMLNEGLQFLINQLMTDKYEELVEQLHIVIVSDHGMASLSNDRMAYLNGTADQYLQYLLPERAYPFRLAWPKEGQEDELVTAISNTPHLTVIKRDSPLAKQLGYSADPYRIPPVILMADEGYVIVKNKTEMDSTNVNGSGGHGFNNSLDSMQGIFFGWGESFHLNYSVDHVELVDVHALVCHLLRLDSQTACQPANVDGNVTRIASLVLRHWNQENHGGSEVALGLLNATLITYILTISLVALIAGYFSLSVLRRYSRPVRYRSFSLQQWSASERGNRGPSASSTDGNFISAGAAGGAGHNNKEPLAGKTYRGRFVNDGDETNQYVPLLHAEENGDHDNSVGGGVSQNANSVTLHSGQFFSDEDDI